MRRVQEAAWLSVARGCGFAALAIATFMFAMSGNIAVALKAGGILSLLTSLVLLVRAWQAPHRPYKRTEVWIILEPDDRPQGAQAQALIGEALKRTYLQFASHAAIIAGGLLLFSLMITGAAILR